MSDYPASRAALRSQAVSRPCVDSTNKLTHDLGSRDGNDTLAERFNLLFAQNVFTEATMAKMVPKSVVKQFQVAKSSGKPCDSATADVISQALKEWAVAKGCTHYTHWFQPLRKGCAEKHDSFVDFFGPQRNMQLEFSGSELSRGEPDASSFPSGGSRNTHSARGYTAWDTSSPPFVIEDHNGNYLVIPTMFLSWSGEALDVKTPLIRSVHGLSEEVVKLLRLIGDDKTQSINVSMGPEQEFFLVDQGFATSRPDIVMCGRTVIGANPPKGQELEDHYFCQLPDRVIAYLQDVEEQLWKLGVPTKTRHAEVAPAQYEMAPIFENINVAADHNLLVMRLLQSQGPRHGLTCLLNEKPFQGMNGSGKHNNWSVSTDLGVNLLNPTDDPLNNTPFQITLAAVIRAVDEHSDLLRASVAIAANDFRLGANEAPPAIMSVYLGDVLEELVDTLIKIADIDSTPRMLSRTNQAATTMLLGKNILPIKRDKSDRNRTSPFAFTGNKFEFRAPGSSQEVGFTGAILNVMLADAMKSMAAELDASLKKLTESGMDIAKARSIAVPQLIAATLKKHRRVVFNGNGYSQEWRDEAARRGLLNVTDSVEALAAFDSDKNKRIFSQIGVLEAHSVTARKNVLLETYAKTVIAEAACTRDLINNHVLPSAYRQQRLLAESVNSTKAALGIAPENQVVALKKFVDLVDGLVAANNELTNALAHKNAPDHEESASSVSETVIACEELTHARYVRDRIRKSAANARYFADSLELLIADEFWTLPKTSEMVWIGV